MKGDKTKAAHDIAERAIDKAAEGDIAAAKRLADRARKLDPEGAEAAVQEVERERENAEDFAKKR